MKTRKPTRRARPNETARLQATIRKLTTEIAVRRDKLREIYDDLESVIGSLDEGILQIESGIDHLSEYL